MIGSALAIALATLMTSPPLADATEPKPEAKKALEITFLGWPREISKSMSASRDAPVFGLSLFPRDIRTASTELALVTIPAQDVTVRTGFYGLIELERPGETTGIGFIFPQASGHFFWRAAYGVYAATSFDALARRLCERCGLEASVMIRHESEHTTSDPGEEDFHDRPIIGDGILIDAAARWEKDRWELIGRVGNQFFIPDRSGYSQGPGIDVNLRYRAWPHLHFFASGSAEALFGTEWNGRQYPDAHVVRGLLGIALPSTLGDIQIYMSADTGHRKGLLVYTEESTLGMGIRLALGPTKKG